MSNENAPVNKTTGMEKIEQIVDERVEQRLSELGIEIRSESDTPGLEDIWVAGQPVGKIIESNRKKADSAREQTREGASSGSESKGESGENGSPSDGLLPIERLSRLKERERDSDEPESPFADTTPSVDRAVAIYDHFRKWADKAPSGRVIRSGLKNLLETATGENLYWSQVGRACRALSEYSKGEIEYKKTNRHGWILVADEQALLAGRG